MNMYPVTLTSIQDYHYHNERLEIYLLEEIAMFCFIRIEGKDIVVSFNYSILVLDVDIN